jgi:hypothetical protein
MSTKQSENAEYYENAPVADEDVQDLMNTEIQSAPRASGELTARLRENHSTSPADSGGDIDADWADADNTGSEAFGGHNPTPDQSDTEANAHAYGVDFQDNEPLDLLEKMEKRDRDRWELEESSKEEGDMI